MASRLQSARDAQARAEKRPALAKFMVVSHFAYNMMKIPAAWGVIKVKADVDDAIYCVQKLNQMVAATADTWQDVQDAGTDAPLKGGGNPGGSATAASKRAPFRGDPQMTKKVALMSDGSRAITICAHLTDK